MHLGAAPAPIRSASPAFVLPAQPACFTPLHYDPTRCSFSSHVSGRHSDLLVEYALPARRSSSRREALSCSQDPGDPHRGEKRSISRENILARSGGTGTPSRSWGGLRPATGGKLVLAALTSIMLMGGFPAELAHAKLTTTAETSPREVVATLRCSLALLEPTPATKLEESLLQWLHLLAERLMGRGLWLAGGI